jgi:diguanylate cyclase (GGDEF)-like protein
MLFAVLAGFGAAAIELTRKAAEPAGLIKEVYVAWQLPVALLLPPVYCLAASAMTFTLLQFRTRRTIVHRRVFSAAASGLSLAGVSVLFHTLNVPADRPGWWLAAAAGCAVLRSAGGTVLVGAAVVLSDRTVSIRRELLSRGPLLNDGCELAAGLLLAGAAARIGLALFVPALPLMAVLQWWCRREQRQSAARLDSQTGLLHTGTWRAEAEVRLAGAGRTGAPLAVGLVNLDQLRAVNDRHGYQAGDAVIAAAAAVVRAGLRTGDLVGRFGGAGFVFLMTAGRDEALRAADRVRCALAAQPIPVCPDGRVLHVTASVGVAATDTPAGCDLLTDLLAAADAALYRAKEGGGDRVCQAPAVTTEAASASPADTGAETARATDREWLAAARLKLGQELAAWRKQAGLSQEELRQRTGYSRSLVASAETGKGANLAFWVAADTALGAGGVLAASAERIDAAVAAARSRAARQSWRARSRAAEPGMTAPHDPGILAAADCACPVCGAALATISRVTTTLIPQIAPPGDQPPADP